MSNTVDEFFEKYEATKFLRENLEANMEALGDEMSEESREMLMRTNLIMIRQCLKDFGVE